MNEPIVEEVDESDWPEWPLSALAGCAQFTQRSLKKNGWLRIDKRRKLSSPTNVCDEGVGPSAPEGHCFHPFEFSTV